MSSIHVLSYDALSPIEIQHSVESGEGILNASVSVNGGEIVGNFSRGAPFRHTLKASPGPISINYLLVGHDRAHYGIATDVFQDGRRERITTRGIFESDVVRHALVLIAKQGSQQPTMREPPGAISGIATPSAGKNLLKSLPGDDARHYPVWFGTNRQAKMEKGSVVGFSSKRSEEVSYGLCTVFVPEAHKIGSTGSSWLKRLLTRTDDRLKIVDLMTIAKEQYWRDLATAIQQAPHDERTAVVFLHGFNVSFDEAALRAAQIGYDLSIRGALAFYSWPSRGTLQGYAADAATIEASEGFITDYLVDVASLSGATHVHLIAHSMGNRALLRAVDRIARSAAAESKTQFSQIILAAADVDQDTFRRLCVAYSQVSERTTLYVSPKDVAVGASDWLYGSPRVGAPPVFVAPGIDTVNVSEIPLAPLGHGYIAEAKELLTDMHELIRHGTPPEKRLWLRKAITGDYWEVKA